MTEHFPMRKSPESTLLPKGGLEPKKLPGKYCCISPIYHFHYPPHHATFSIFSLPAFKNIQNFRMHQHKSYESDRPVGNFSVTYVASAPLPVPVISQRSKFRDFWTRYKADILLVSFFPSPQPSFCYRRVIT